jgi:hypothetical protein
MTSSSQPLITGTILLPFKNFLKLANIFANVKTGVFCILWVTRIHFKVDAVCSNSGLEKLILFVIGDIDQVNSGCRFRRWFVVVHLSSCKYLREFKSPNRNAYHFRNAVNYVPFLGSFVQKKGVLQL